MILSFTSRRILGASDKDNRNSELQPSYVLGLLRSLGLRLRFGSGHNSGQDLNTESGRIPGFLLAIHGHSNVELNLLPVGISLKHKIQTGLPDCWNQNATLGGSCNTSLNGNKRFFNKIG